MEPTEHKFIISHPEDNIIIEEVAGELLTALRALSTIPSTLLYCRYVICCGTHADIRSHTMNITVKNSTLIVFDPDDGVYASIKNDPDLKVILILSANAIAHNDAACKQIMSLKDQVAVVLTPVPTWLDNGAPVEPGKEMEHALAQAKRRLTDKEGIRFIKYLGTIPKAAVPDKTKPRNGLVAVAWNSVKDYDWCLVEHALKKYDVDLLLFEDKDKTNEVIRGAIPTHIFDNINFRVRGLRSIQDMATAINHAKGIVGLTAMSNRILSAVDYTYLMPAYFEVFSNYLQEGFMAGANTSILASPDIRIYESLWAELVTGILDPADALKKLNATLNCDTYPGLYVTADSPYSLLNIVMKNELLVE